MRRALPHAAALAVIALAGCGDSFAAGDAAGSPAIAAGGAGGAVTSTSGAGGATTTSTGAGGATTTSTGAGGATTTSTGTGGATTTTTPPPPVCEGTFFSTVPSVPTAGLPFELHMDIAKAGQGWTCIDFAFTCAGGAAVVLEPGHLTASGYAASWSVQGCGAGAVHARFAQHVKTNANCYCDGDPGTCPDESDAQVTDGGSVEAECGFTIGG